MKVKDCHIKKIFFYAVLLLMSLLQMQCKSYELQVVTSDNNNNECFEPTLIVDSCIVEHQYEGKKSKTLLRIEITGDNQSVPQWAFAIVPSLVEVKLSPKIQTIEDNAFFSCKQLVKINLHDIDMVGENSFKNSALEEVDLSQAKIIKEFAFANCTALRNVVLFNKLETIGDFAFSGDTSLPSCYIPAGNIGDGAFMGCSKLAEIKFGKVISIGNAAFLDCKSLSHVVIPSTIKSVGSDAFAGCTNLKDVIINSRDTQIAKNAFEKDVVITYKTDNQ